MAAAIACAAPVAQAAVPNVVNGPPDRVALDGPWTARLDPGDTGLHSGWRTGAFAGTPVTIPWDFNVNEVTGTAGIRAFQGSVGWYRTTFTVPGTGRYVLRFESVNHRAAVFLDGRLLGGHTGTYLPFEFRVPVDGGRPHTLVVRADWRCPRCMRAQGWGRTWFNFGGINREATIRPVGRSEIVAPTLHTTLSGAEAQVSVSAHVRNDTGAPREIGVMGALTHGDQRVDFSLAGPVIAPHATAVDRGTVTVPRAALWAPGSPNLYDLDLRAGAGGANEGGWHARVGLRELTWRDGALRLNGKPLTLRGVSIQEDARGRGDALLPADQDLLAAILAGMGANTTRSQHPLDEGMLERLDAAGVLVWQGVGPVDPPGRWTSTTPALARHARDRVRATLRQAQLHPSIVAWNLANEVGGNGQPGQVAYVRAMARELHVHDPGRLVALDVWGAHAPLRPGAIYRDVDAVGVTNYVGWYQDPFAPPATTAARVARRVGRLLRAFRGKVVVVSEFGAEGNTRNAQNAPGGYAFQSQLLTTHIDAYRQIRGLDGWLVWDLRDFAVAPSFAGGSIHRVVPNIRLVRGLNQKGLVTWGDRAKPAALTVRGLLLDLDALAHARGAL